MKKYVPFMLIWLGVICCGLPMIANAQCYSYAQSRVDQGYNPPLTQPQDNSRYELCILQAMLKEQDDRESDELQTDETSLEKQEEDDLLFEGEEEDGDDFEEEEESEKDVSLEEQKSVDDMFVKGKELQNAPEAAEIYGFYKNN